MKNLDSLPLSFINGTLRVLDQQKLPFVEERIVCNSPDDMVYMIKELKVRGAPILGVAAAMALAHFVEKGASKEEVYNAANKLISARPTAYNLAHCITKQIIAFERSGELRSIVQTAEELFEEDRALSAAIAFHGDSLIQDGDSLLTHCNTGRLISTGIGTALGAILQAHQNGKRIHVYVGETRPLLQGARLTAWELAREGVPHTLICDNMAASLMRLGRIDRVITGADRIAQNGDTANKIGTYSVAALCHLHNIPFHIATPRTTIDPYCLTGDNIVIEERNGYEVRGVHSALGNVKWAEECSPVYNPSFDVTPARYITNFITDLGVHKSIPQMKDIR